MTYTLFVDDERMPRDVSSVVVRTYNEACKYVTINGTPDHVDFDHDLGDGESGHDFAKWLVNRALDGHGFPSSFAVHSQNPIGRKNITETMNSYLKFALTGKAGDIW